MDTIDQLLQDERELDLGISELDFRDIKKKKEKNYRQTETRKGTQKIKDITDITFKELASEVEKFVPNTTRSLKITLAVAASGTKRGSPMLWVMLVGNPSSGKTEIVTLIKKSIHTYSLDSMTMSAFITGERSTKNNKAYDLLPELNKKCFVIKDWTTLFSLYEEMTSKIIGDLVNIYDEEFAKFSATRGNITYKSNFSHMGCITPSTLNKHIRYLSTIGARFLFYNMPFLNDEQREKSFEAIFERSDRRKKKRELVILTSKFLNKISTLSIKNIKPLTNEVKLFLRVSAEFISRARGIVITQASTFKDEEGKDITYYELLEVQIEEPWRALQQLIRLSKYLALVEEKDEVGIEELEIIKDIALSSMPANRAQALSVFKDPKIEEISAKDLADYSEKEFNLTKSVKTAKRLLDELVYLGILEKDKGLGSIATTYRLKREFKDYVSLSPAEFLSAYGKTKDSLVEDAQAIFGI